MTVAVVPCWLVIIIVMYHDMTSDDAAKENSRNVSFIDIVTQTLVALALTIIHLRRRALTMILLNRSY